MAQDVHFAAAFATHRRGQGNMRLIAVVDRDYGQARVFAPSVQGIAADGLVEHLVRVQGRAGAGDLL